MAQQQALGISTPTQPRLNPVTLPFVFDFTNNASYEINLTIEQEKGIIDVVQCVYIDNLENNSRFDVIFAVTGQRISCKANSQGYFPVLTVQQPIFTVARASGAAAEATYMQVLNVPLPLAMWTP